MFLGGWKGRPLGHIPTVGCYSAGHNELASPEKTQEGSATQSSQQKQPLGKGYTLYVSKSVTSLVLFSRSSLGTSSLASGHHCAHTLDAHTGGPGLGPFA